MTELFWFIVTIAIFYFLFKWLDKGNADKKNHDPHYVQDLFQYKEIYDNGLIALNNGTFAIVLDVVPIKMNMKNQSEKDSVWFNFRSLVNSLPTHHSFILQSQYLDMTDYIDNYIATSKDRERVQLTPELERSAEDVGAFLRNQYSERKTRDYKGYVIVRYNPFSQGTEAGISTGNADIDNLIQLVKGETNTLPDDEAEELAQNMMDEVASLIYSSFDTIRCRVSRLDKEGVLTMLHQTMNRDLAPYESLSDLHDRGSFSQFKQSLTPHMMAQHSTKKEVS